MLANRKNEYGFQNCCHLISTGSFHKRRLFFVSVLPPLLRKTPFADESEILRLKWRAGRGTQCAGRSFRFVGNAFQIEIICSHPIQNSKTALPKAIFRIHPQTPFEVRHGMCSTVELFKSMLCFRSDFLRRGLRSMSPIACC